ncbi:DUF397 domain-containing protein [Streptomyces albidoflavus]|nr:DUF397 domain-containing protein [Streptomyces albidoflavus]
MSSTPDGHWVKSSYSANGGNNCVEWAPSVALATGTVPVRDSKAVGPTSPSARPHGRSL